MKSVKNGLCWNVICFRDLISALIVFVNVSCNNLTVNWLTIHIIIDMSYIFYDLVNPIMKHICLSFSQISSIEKPDCLHIETVFNRIRTWLKMIYFSLLMKMELLVREILFKFVHWDNQYISMRVSILAQWNNGRFWLASTHVWPIPTRTLNTMPPPPPL